MTGLLSVDSVEAFLEEADKPRTRENYIFVLFGGNPPEELDPEEELLLPADLRVTSPEEP